MQQQVRGLSCQRKHVDVRITDDQLAEPVTHADDGLRHEMTVDRGAHGTFSLAGFDHGFELLAVMRTQRFQTTPALARQVEALVVVDLERLGSDPGDC
jgi:hypothetical protein